jgi:hypothetical protein
MGAGEIIALVALVGTGAGTLGTVAWRLIAYINRVDERREKGEQILLEKIEGVATSLDGKFNIARNEISAVKDNYVRRDDLDGDITRLEFGMRDQTVALNALRERFDEILVLALKNTDLGQNRPARI